MNEKIDRCVDELMAQVNGGQVVDPSKPGFGQETRWDLVCKVCGACLDAWYGPVPDNGAVIYRDCTVCGGKRTAWWVHIKEV